MTIKIDSEKNPSGVYVECSGVITGKDLIDINQVITGCSSYTYQLFDFTKITNLEITPEEMHIIVMQDDSLPLNTELSKAAIVGNQKTLKGLDEIYHIISGQWVGRRRPFESQTFKSVEDARDWIGC